MVVTGDDTQIDLPRGVRSGLLDVERLFTTWSTSGSFACEPPTWCGTRWSAGSLRRTSDCLKTATRDLSEQPHAQSRPRYAFADRKRWPGCWWRSAEDDTSVSLVFVRDRRDA